MSSISLSALFRRLELTALARSQWGVADGGNYITPTSEMVAYGVLDILAKPVFSVVHLMSLSRLDHARLGMVRPIFSSILSLSLTSLLYEVLVEGL